VPPLIDDGVVDYASIVSQSLSVSNTDAVCVTGLLSRDLSWGYTPLLSVLTSPREWYQLVANHLPKHRSGGGGYGGE